MEKFRSSLPPLSSGSDRVAVGGRPDNDGVLQVYRGHRNYKTVKVPS